LHLSGKELIDEVLRRTEGRGVDVVLEAVGRAETVVASIECVRRGGTVALIGNIQPEVPLPLQRVVTREIRLQGSCASAGEYSEAIRLMSHGAITVKPLISAMSSLEQASDWFRRLYNHEAGLLKVVVAPNGTLEAKA
jgi:L-iditol 2-dehydrogenase